MTLHPSTHDVLRLIHKVQQATDVAALMMDDMWRCRCLRVTASAEKRDLTQIENEAWWDCCKRLSGPAWDEQRLLACTCKEDAIRLAEDLAASTRDRINTAIGTLAVAYGDLAKVSAWYGVDPESFIAANRVLSLLAQGQIGNETGKLDTAAFMEAQRQWSHWLRGEDHPEAAMAKLMAAAQRSRSSRWASVWSAANAVLSNQIVATVIAFAIVGGMAVVCYRVWGVNLTDPASSRYDRPDVLTRP